MIKRILLVACVGLLLAIGTQQGIAQVVPYKASGTGYYVPPLVGNVGVYGGEGVATHLGKHTFLGNVTVTSTANPFVFDFEILSTDPQETVAANGDKIYFSGAGQVHLIPQDLTFTVFTAVWTGHFNVEGGTGRFREVGPGPHPLDVIAINDPFTFADPVWSFDWELKGKIRLH